MKLLDYNIYCGAKFLLRKLENKQGVERMRFGKKVLSLITIVILLFPIMASAVTIQEAVIGGQKVMHSLVSLDSSSPKKQKSTELSYLDPLSYPLKTNGQNVDTLLDSYLTNHNIIFEGISDYSPSEMDLGILYGSSSAYLKDRILSVEIFQQNNGVLSFYGDTYFDTYSYSDLQLGIILDKTDFANQQYIFVRLGVSGSVADPYYSDVTMFKVVNPYYVDQTEPEVPSDPGDTTGQGQYVIVNNESVNGTLSQYTGSFQINNDFYSFNRMLDSKTYQRDVNKRFDAAANKDKQLSRNYFSISPTYQLGDSKDFWVTNFTTNLDYQINAKLLYSGTKSNVWVYNNQITSQDAAKLGNEFDNQIRPVVAQNFANESDVNGDGKVNILCYDIQDGFSGYGGYIGGYFYGGDLFNYTHSNFSEIFYIDTYPLMGSTTTKDVTASYETLAHEFQHMVNFNQNVLVEGNMNQMDVWLDEALAMAAEQIYTGQPLTDRINYYNISNSITNGHSLLYWDDYGDVLANYSLSYLFGQYVKIQANQGNNIFKEIIMSPYSDYRAVEGVVKKYIDPNLTFGKFTTKFRSALLLKEATGLNGFKENPGFDQLQPKIYNGSSTYLRGGGAVVKQLTPGEVFTAPTNKGTNITYTILSDGGSDQTPLNTPLVNPVSDKDVQVTGKTAANAKVYIYVGSTLLASGNADSTGNFLIPIVVQKAGTNLSIYTEDEAGNKSDSVTVTVLDKTAPLKPVVNTVGDNSTTVTGKAEANSTVYVKKDTTVLGQATTSSTGAFSVPIPKQIAGTKLTIYAQDQAGNKSSAVYVTVVDKTAPAKPGVTVIGDNQTIVVGTAEAGSKVTLKLGTTVLYTTYANNNGYFTMTIAKQKAGTTLSLYATDKVGNQSAAASVKVVDVTAPKAPTVNKVTIKSTTVTGKAEAYSTVYVKVGSKIIGSAKANQYGNFSVIIPKQITGTNLYVYAKDVAGNSGSSTKVVVQSY